MSSLDRNEVNRTSHCIALSASSLLFGLTFSIGIAFIAIPELILTRLLKLEDAESGVTCSDLKLARITGALLLSLAFSSATLLSAEWFRKFSVPPSPAAVDKCRSSLSAQALLGLIVVLVSLLNDRLDDDDDDNDNDDEIPVERIQYEWFLGTGCVYLVFAGAGLMASFWPSIPSSDRRDRESPIRTFDDVNAGSRAVSRCCCCPRRNQRSELETDTGLSEALLPEHPTPDFRAQNGAMPVETPALLSDEDDPDVSSSRMEGTMRLIKLAAPQVFYLYLGCAVLLVRLPFSLSIPHFVSTTLGALARSDYDAARMEILLLFILGTIDAALDFWCVFLFGYAKERIVRGVRIDTFSSILRQEIAFFDRHTSGELASRLSSDCGEMAGDLTWFFRFSIESVVRIVGITIYMLVRSPVLGGCALCIVPFVGVVNKLYGDWLRKNAMEVQTALAQANSVAQEALACVRTVISFSAEESEEFKYQDRIDHQYRLNVRQLFLTGVYYMVVSTFLINTCVQAALLLIGTLLIEQGKLTSEILLAFMLYQGGLQNETMNLFNSYSSLIKSSGAGDKVFKLLDRKPPPPGTGNVSVLARRRDHNNGGDDDEGETDSPRRSHSQSTVRLEDLNFFYPSRPQHHVLSGLNLEIPAGSTMALVGSSGCGKSTIVALLQRYYDPSSGSIMVDGTDLRTMDVKDYRRHIGVVTQDPVLFSGSILSNITYGCSSATREEAEEAARMANAHDFIVRFPDQYNTNVGERGIQLSGGQKQRIAIARAIVKNPSLLLLDEATSSLDAESEHVVQEALDRLLNENKDMTTVIIAHRLRTVRNCDCIAFVKDGKVVEQGTHDELVERSEGHYKRMVQRADIGGQLPDS